MDKEEFIKYTRWRNYFKLIYMSKRLYISLIFSNLVVIKTLSSNHRMHNLYRLTRQSPWQGLTKHQRYPIEKERNVPYPTQLASKSFQLGIERFCRCVGSA